MLGLQQVVDRARLAGQLRTPECELRLRDVGCQDGHGVVRADTHGSKQVCSRVNVGQHLPVTHHLRGLRKVGSRQIAKGVPVCETLRSVGNQAVGCARGNGLFVGGAFERLDVGEAAKSVCRHAAAAWPRLSSRIALPLRMPGITSGLKPASSKSFIQRSGVISG